MYYSIALMLRSFQAKLFDQIRSRTSRLSFCVPKITILAMRQVLVNHSSIESR